AWSAPGKPLMAVAEALEVVLGRRAPVVESERVPLAEALGRILAEPVVSPVDVPGTDNSAVDGYAVHFDDLDPAAETRLPVVGRATAGHPYGGALPRGAALRIFTGALMPASADTLMMQEECRLEGGAGPLRAGIKRARERPQ